MKKAALVTKSLLKGVFLKTMQDVIENDDGTEATQKTHSALSNEVDAYLIETPSKIPKVGKKLSEADKEALDSCFAPIIQRSVENIYIVTNNMTELFIHSLTCEFLSFQRQQSGGAYDLSVSAESSDEKLSYDIIIASLGARYNFYCSWVTRTYFVDATDEQKEVYEVLCAAQSAAVHAMKPGQPLSEVYTAAKRSVEKSSKPDLVQYMGSRVGAGIGLEFREHLFLSAKEKRFAKANMMFNLEIGFTNVPHSAVKTGKDGAQGLATYSVKVRACS